MIPARLRMLANLQRQALTRYDPPSRYSVDDLERSKRINLETEADVGHSLGLELRDPHAIKTFNIELWPQAKQACLNELMWSMDNKAAVSEVERADQEGRSYIDANPDLPINPYWYWVLRKQEARIAHAARQMGYQVPDNFSVGNMSTGRVNAMILREEQEHSFLIVLNDGLKTFTNYFCKLFAATNIRNLEKIEQLLNARSEVGDDRFQCEVAEAFPESFQSFETNLNACLYIGNTSEGDRVRLNSHEHRVANTIEQCMDMFVMGHEFGHLVLGHLECGAIRRSNVDEVVMKHDQEFDADRCGLALMLKACSGVCPDRTFAFVGAFLFLILVDVVERAISLATTGSEGVIRSATHPPTHLRILRMWRAGDHVLAEWPASIGHARQIASFASILFSVWLQKAAPTLRRNHADGMPLSGVWYPMTDHAEA